nr:unnamed protein product [Digitaria exilis]
MPLREPPAPLHPTRVGHLRATTYVLFACAVPLRRGHQGAITRDPCQPRLEPMMATRLRLHVVDPVADFGVTDPLHRHGRND